MKKQIILILSAVGVLGLVLMSIFYIQSQNRVGIEFEDKDFNGSQTEEQEIGSMEVESVEGVIAHIYVDVKGCVKEPGVYQVNDDMRVIDVIEVAGGFISDANRNAINLSEKIKDEMVIYVPSVEEEGNYEVLIKQEEGRSDKVNINRADATLLQSLPGIGQVKADAIVAYREEFGAFKAIEELTQVSGIGAKTLDGIKDLIDY